MNVRHYLTSMHASRQPFFARQSYVHEMRTALTYPLAAAMAEGGFAGIVALKYFHAHPVIVGVITAAPMFGNILALLWSELGRSRRKVPFINSLQAGVVITIAAVGLTALMPLEIGAIVFAALMIVARVLASGIMTLRAAIWRYNYPRKIRARIVARITVLATTVLAITTGLGAALLDRHPAAYAALYPAAALIGLLGIWQFSHIRVRKEGQLLRRVRSQWAGTTSAQGVVAAASETGDELPLAYEPQAPSLLALIREAFDVLRKDRAYRRYQMWQSTMGASFMMIMPVLTVLISKELTDPKRDYLLATTVLQLIPLVVAVVFTGIWAPIFDRMHITQFRVLQGSVSVTAQAMIFAGAWADSLPFVAAAMVVMGITNAAGALAWNLGHNDFAPPDKTATYMGIHVMLTGLRGMFAPFIGIALYASPIGRGVFAIAAALCLISTIGFWTMARSIPPNKTKPATP